MSTKQTIFFKGNARAAMPTPFKVGDGHTVMFTHVFTEDVATTDILELIPIPAGCRVTGLDFASENLGALNLTFGVMSGVAGDATTVRTCGAEFIPAVAAAGPASAALLALINVGLATEDHRSIGVVPSVSVVAGATKKLHIRLQYAA